MIKLVYKPNILEGKELSCHLMASTIREAIDKMAGIYPELADLIERGGYDIFIASVNDLEVPKDMWGTYPVQDNDEIILSHDVGWTTIALVVGAIWSYVTSTAFLVNLAITVAIYAISYFTRPDPPKTGGGSGGYTSESPTYSWSGIVRKEISK